MPGLDGWVRRLSGWSEPMKSAMASFQALLDKYDQPAHR
jgi:hypothetical protein